MDGLLRKLSEPNFLDRAPAEVVAREKTRCRELEEEVAKLRASLAELETGITTRVDPRYSIPSRLMSSWASASRTTSRPPSRRRASPRWAGRPVWSARAAARTSP